MDMDTPPHVTCDNYNKINTPQGNLTTIPQEDTEYIDQAIL